MAGRFTDAATVEQLVYQIVGAGSTCWQGGTGEAVFDDVLAREVAEDGLRRLRQLAGWTR